VLILELEGALADLTTKDPRLNNWGPQGESNAWRAHQARWTQLRAELGRAPEDAYLAAKAWADAKQSEPLETRALLAFAFDSEPYADALLRDARAQGVRPAVLTLAFSSAREVQLIAEVGAGIAAKHPAAALERVADLLERFASDAPALERIFLAWFKEAEALAGASRPSQGFIDALACVGTQGAAEKVVQTLGTAQGKLLATRYFKRFPELAPLALAPLIKKRGKVGDTAKVLLETFVAASAKEEAVAPPKVEAEGTSEGPPILREPPWRSWAKSGFLVIDEPPTPNFALPPEAAAKHDRHAWVAKLPSLPLSAVTTSGAAFFVAHAWHTKKAERADAEVWLETFAPIAAYGLITFVIGPPGPSRTIATTALRHVWKTLGEDRGTKILARWCDDTGQAATLIVPSVLAILKADARWECPSTPTAMPSFVVLSALPIVRTKEGQELTEKARRHLVEMMVFAGADESAQRTEYVGVAEAREALDAGSLDAFSWALYETWTAVGVRTKTSWPLHQLAFFGGPNTEHRLSAQIRSMAAEASVERALTATSVLARLKTLRALVHLAALEHSKNERVREQARALLAQAASDRGVSLHALMDELVPSVSMESTTRDEAMVAELESATKAQSKRLERAMCTRATWPLERFRSHFIAQPFLRQMSLGILWSASRETERTCFRVAEDGTFANVEDATLELDEGVQIRIPHALELDAETRAHWAQRFAEYQLTQPFDQLGREAFTLAPEEVGSASLPRLMGTRGETALFFALEQRGWSILGARVEVFGAEKARLRFTLKTPVNLVQPRTTPTFEVIHAGFMEDASAPRTWSDLELSELLRDLAPLTR
jgi:hypothetical protein